MMNESTTGADISSYVENLGTLNRFEKEQATEFGRLAQLKSAELSRIEESVAELKSIAAQRGGRLEEAKDRLVAVGIPAGFAVVQPPDFNPESTASQIVEMLDPITDSATRHASDLPRLHARHRGMQRDMVILPVFAFGLLLCLVMVVLGRSLAGVFYALAGGGLASQFVRVLGGGWTFRRLGGQDYTPQRPGQTAGSGALAAFLVFDGLLFLFWGLLSLPEGLLPGLIVGGSLLAMPALRVRDVLSLDEQTPR